MTDLQKEDYVQLVGTEYKGHVDHYYNGIVDVRTTAALFVVPRELVEKIKEIPPEPDRTWLVKVELIVNHLLFGYVKNKGWREVNVFNAPAYSWEDFFEQFGAPGAKIITFRPDGVIGGNRNGMG